MSAELDSMAQHLVFAIEAMYRHKAELESRIRMLERILYRHEQHITPSIVMQLKPDAEKISERCI